MSKWVAIEEGDRTKTKTMSEKIQNKCHGNDHNELNLPSNDDVPERA